MTKQEQELVLKSLQGLADVVGKIVDRLDNAPAKVETAKEATPEVREEPKRELPSQGTPQALQSTGFPIPMEYRDIVQSMLNGNFGIQIEPASDPVPGMLFTVVVPDKYSNMDAAERSVKKVDLRTKNIPYAEGANGVRIWIEKVFNNFPAEIKAQIVADRAMLQ